jgi:hypothetical protein
MRALAQALTAARLAAPLPAGRLLARAAVSPRGRLPRLTRLHWASNAVLLTGRRLEARKSSPGTGTVRNPGRNPKLPLCGMAKSWQLAPPAPGVMAAPASVAPWASAGLAIGAACACAIISSLLSPPPRIARALLIPCAPAIETGTAPSVGCSRASQGEGRPTAANMTVLGISASPVAADAALVRPNWALARLARVKRRRRASMAPIFAGRM